MVAQLILVQFVLVRVQVGQPLFFLLGQTSVVSEDTGREFEEPLQFSIGQTLNMGWCDSGLAAYTESFLFS